MATWANGREHETRQRFIEELVQALQESISEESVSNGTTQVQREGERQGELRLAATKVVTAATRVEAANRESTAAVAALHAAVVALEAIRQTKETALSPKQSTSSNCVRHQCGKTVIASEGGSRCASGHILCASCTAQYVAQTLLSHGDVPWDTMLCMGPGCTAHLTRGSVQRCIGHGLAVGIDAAQVNGNAPADGPKAGRERCGVTETAAAAAAAAATRVPEHDHASGKAGDEIFKPCPKCAVPTEKVGGSDHMTCMLCKHDYYWSCRTKPGAT